MGIGRKDHEGLSIITGTVEDDLRNELSIVSGPAEEIDLGATQWESATDIEAWVLQGRAIGQHESEVGSSIAAAAPDVIAPPTPPLEAFSAPAVLQTACDVDTLTEQLRSGAISYNQYKEQYRELVTKQTPQQPTIDCSASSPQVQTSPSLYCASPSGSIQSPLQSPVGRTEALQVSASSSEALSKLP